MTKDELLTALISAPDPDARRLLMGRSAEVLSVDIVYALKEQADQLEQDDARQALTIGVVAGEVAEQLKMDEARAVALWTQANAHDFLAENESAVRCYQRAAEFFNLAGMPLEASRTAIGHMFTLMQLGQFDQCQTLAQSARAVFARHGDTLSLAKIDMNLGNLHYQQGKYARALEDYKQATASFFALGETLYGAMNQINQANALLMLDDFLAAEQMHVHARPVFEEADLRTAVASVDYDLALLQYARGNYADALRIFERARAMFASLELQVNIAMTDLGECELYLDLNLPDEALNLARRAEEAFAEMGMTFELARSKANHAVALARLGQREKADGLLIEAQGLFVALGNDASVAQTHLQRAELLGKIGQPTEAIELARQAATIHEKLGMKTKQSYSHILTARFLGDMGEWDRSVDELQQARKTLVGLHAPWLSQRIEAGMGRALEGMGDPASAVEHYEKAVDAIEQITSSLTADELRTAFVADKLAPYEALVIHYASSEPALSFRWAEQARSRALLDLLSAGIRPRLHVKDEMDAQQVKRLEEIREELNWLYTRLTRGVAPGESGAPLAVPETWGKINEREQEATSIWRSLQGRHAEELSLIRGSPLPTATIQGTLKEGTALVEYFIAHDQIMAFVITPENIHSLCLPASRPDVLALMENLAFQFSKFQYGKSYYERHRAVLLQNTRDILEKLGRALIAPLWDHLSSAKDLIVIPHGPLHSLPFHALRMNGQYLIETHGVSYGPSAAVLKFCWDRQAPNQNHGQPLLVGIPDERISHVADEIQALANIFTGATVLMGEQATFEQVKQAAASCDVLHLAAHGLFRPEAPLLSSIKLADRWLAVQDIYDLDLNASLVTLSACETGLGHDAGGDDLVGLVRGFLYAGAASLVVSLWTVDDKSMTGLVTGFYSHWLAGHSRVDALRQAQVSLMKEYEHPYYWAPLILLGNER
jgi:tetratricopeptide (TPR) repeat protein